MKPTACRDLLRGSGWRVAKALATWACIEPCAIGNGQAVLARADGRDPSHWKRYRGGTAGKLWIAPAIDGEYKPLIDLDGNLACPLWAGSRVYFVSDHEGVGNLYSCTAKGRDLRLEAAHEEFYIRNPATDGQTIVYHAGGDLYAFDVASRTSRKLAIEYHSQRTQRQRSYVQAAKYLESADLDPKGERGVYSVRGQIHHMRHWDGPVSAHCVPGSRCRLARFLADGRRVIVVIDRDNGDECLEIWDTQDYTVTPVAGARGEWSRAGGVGAFHPCSKPLPKESMWRSPTIATSYGSWTWHRAPAASSPSTLMA